MAQELYWIWLAEHCGAGSTIPAQITGMGLTAKDVYEGALDSADDLDDETRAHLNKKLTDRDLGEAE
ncbi:MAG: hypothetical protein IJ334_00385, partial [Clostridia bacterium]|nr:hypothetical protein [Clostridia bacterium]